MFATELARAHGVALATFGEPVLLPSGRVVSGIFLGPRQPVGYQRGRSTLEAALDQPRVTLLSSDAAELAERAEIVVRGVRYAVARPPLPDGAGMTLLILVPAQDAAPPPGGWR